MPAFSRRNFSAYPSSHFLYRNTTNTVVGTNTKELPYCSSRTKVVSFLLFTFCYTLFLYERGGAGRYLEPNVPKVTKSISQIRKLTISSWNIAAINNNPFEYWLTIEENPEYEDLMVKVEGFIDAPGDFDVSVDSVFTEEMFEKLEKRMEAATWDSVRDYWNNNLRHRKIVSGFLKDPMIGSKRLVSMLDRVTNTIYTTGSNTPVCRPSVINMYDGDLSDLETWFNSWLLFMFDNPLSIPPENVNKMPFQFLLPIKKSKYPDITVEEENMSLPLQTVCGAIFDAILVHMMNTVSEPDIWQPLKRKIVNSLNKQKIPKTLLILEQNYISNDIVTLQEVSASLVELAMSSGLGDAFHIVSSEDMDSVRDQNSVILLSRDTFPKGVLSEISSNVVSNFPQGKDVPVTGGDLLVITTEDKFGNPFIIASFHGDTNGLATIPVVDATIRTISSSPSLQNHKLIFGLDANTYENAIPGKTQDVLEFGKVYRNHNLTSCWGDVPDPKNYTTFNARTYLQPQLNKACKSHEKKECGDINPKDFILFPNNKFEIIKTWKDNTGNHKYEEDMTFPTLKFPSDHGILSTTIVEI